MNVKTTVILLILVIACTAYVVFFHTDWFGRKAAPPAPEAADKSLTPGVGKVQRLVLERPGAARIVLARREEKWHLVEPIDAPAVAWQADSIVSTLTTLRYVRKHAPDDPDFPKDDLTHLSAPPHAVSFTDDKNAAFGLKIGRKVSLSKQTYVQVNGDPHVYVVDADLAESLKKTAGDYRQADVARFNTDQAVRVQVVGEQSYQLVKVDDKWSIDRPVPARADQDKVKSLLRDISNVSADKFINDAPTPQDLAGYGLDKPRLSVTVELAPPKPTTAPSTSPAAPATQPARGEVITIVFGKIADEKAFAKRASEPWVFQVAESKLKDLQPKLIDLRDKHVLEIAGKEISRVEVSPPAGAASTLEKADDAWQMRKPFAGPCDDEAVEKLTEALRELQASEFVDNPATFAAFGLDPPAGKIVLHFRGSDKTTTLMLGRKSESGQTGFVRDATGKSVAVVKSDDYETLGSPAAKYWTRTILELPADAEIVRVDLERQDGKSAVIRDDEGEYRLVRPAAGGPDKDVGPGDKENVEALMDALKSVKAEKILSLGPAAPPDLVKAKPMRALVTYRVPLPPPAPASQPTTASAPATMPATAPASQPATQPVRYKTHPGVALRVVQQDGKSCVWKEGAVPVAVGELAGDFHDKLAAEMRDRSILKIAADKAVSLKLDREKLSLEVLRSGEQWRYAGDSFFKVDARKVKDFLAELGKIKAVRFADYREKPPLKQFALDKPAVRVAVKTEAGASILLSVSSTGPQGQTSRYAASSQVPGVFVLAQEDAAKLQKGLADFKKP